jgi:hypothetical protein
MKTDKARGLDVSRIVIALYLASFVCFLIGVCAGYMIWG